MTKKNKLLARARILTSLLLVIFNLRLIPVFSQPADTLVISRINDIKFDGMPDEAGWDAIDPVPVIQFEPNAGAPATQRTEIRFAHDDKYFYGSIRAYDSVPSGIRMNSLYRDQLAGSDHFEIMLDTYNDNENGYIFSTTPAGIRNDVAVTNDATAGTVLGGSFLNFDFNTFWDARAVVNDKGWFAEVRIPFSSLRFQEHDGKVIMGLTVQRKIARISERDVFPAVKPETDWQFLKPSVAEKIIIRGIKPTKRVYLTPYLLGGFKQWHELNEANSGYDRKTEFQKEIGGDVKYSITNNLTMDFTVNTDFAQAEADNQLINLSRFSLFYPEKRQFFQERAGIFNITTGGQSRLFYSRRIGLTASGIPVPIYGGARLVGRIGTWDIGLLDMQTHKQDSIPSENFGVLRLRHRIFNPYSYAGGMFTSRLGTNGSYNYAYGLDGLIRLQGDDYLTYQWTQTFDDIPRIEFPVSGINNSRFAVEVTRRRRQGFGYDVSTIYSGINNNPGIGFLDRSDFKYGSSAVSYTWFYKNNLPLIWQKLQLTGFAYLGNQNDKIESAEFGPEWNFSTRSLDQGFVELKSVYEKLDSGFILADNVSVPKGSYHFFRVGGKYTMGYDKRVKTNVGLETGKFYDGWRSDISFSPSWYVSKHLQLSADYIYNHIDFNDRDQHLDSHIIRMKIQTAVNIKLSANAFLQYNSNNSLFSANLRIRYNFSEGSDLWIVFNEGLNTTRYDYTPVLPLSDAQSVLVKYTHTFQF